ncbi:hypothetical protein ACFFJY_00920 [Fictibacillus aquaticus]|uniref:Uncharacterized protein n=1 Tax=Fictibacillus aquaticus TaxID=2021314 RepID=A0A235F7K2_9BACL|nr:hypothetical protein [Fictibacillus aquaticus]OYD57286.1 hypothetical protein CGZ90_11400 [Fictibacillus aquaticus]
MSLWRVLWRLFAISGLLFANFRVLFANLEVLFANPASLFAALKLLFADNLVFLLFNTFICAEPQLFACSKQERI